MYNIDPVWEISENWKAVLINTYWIVKHVVVRLNL